MAWVISRSCCAAWLTRHLLQRAKVDSAIRLHEGDKDIAVFAYIETLRNGGLLVPDR